MKLFRRNKKYSPKFLKYVLDYKYSTRFHKKQENLKKNADPVKARIFLRLESQFLAQGVFSNLAYRTVLALHLMGAGFDIVVLFKVVNHRTESVNSVLVNRFNSVDRTFRNEVIQYLLRL
jgi:hypothetical protein